MYIGPVQGKTPIWDKIYFKNINFPSIRSFAAIVFLFKLNDCVTYLISQFKCIGNKFDLSVT